MTTLKAWSPHESSLMYSYCLRVCLFNTFAPADDGETRFILLFVVILSLYTKIWSEAFAKLHLCTKDVTLAYPVKRWIHAQCESRAREIFRAKSVPVVNNQRIESLKWLFYVGLTHYIPFPLGSQRTIRENNTSCCNSIGWCNRVQQHVRAVTLCPWSAVNPEPEENACLKKNIVMVNNRNCPMSAPMGWGEYFDEIIRIHEP